MRFIGLILGFCMSKRPTLDFVIDSLKQALPIIQEHALSRVGFLLLSFMSST
ncbi:MULTISPECIES: hypothetical protein [unclassified Lysinibacillus]|uniref:hypothetical protein n=1 Tax=unclassified Lysinibacillus TaxID=2636778 RepID=UPI003814D98A